jgi:hypothetical protein
VLEKDEESDTQVEKIQALAYTPHSDLKTISSCGFVTPTACTTIEITTRHAL